MQCGSGRKPTCGASRGSVSTSGTCANGLCRFESFLGGGCSSGGAGDSLLSQHPIQEVAQADPGNPGRQEAHAMANKELVEILRQGADAWNAWRRNNPEIEDLDLREANLGGMDLREVNL